MHALAQQLLHKAAVLESLVCCRFCHDLWPLCTILKHQWRSAEYSRGDSKGICGVQITADAGGSEYLLRYTSPNVIYLNDLVFFF